MDMDPIVMEIAEAVSLHNIAKANRIVQQLRAPESAELAALRDLRDAIDPRFLQACAAYLLVNDMPEGHSDALNAIAHLAEAARKAGERQG